MRNACGADIFACRVLLCFPGGKKTFWKHLQHPDVLFY